MKRRAIGILYGAIGAVCYGTNPLFALHLYSNGYDSNSVLFYRYFTAVVIFGFWTTFVKKISLKLEKREIIPLIAAALMFSFSSLTLFRSYYYIDGGIASVILFIYPVFVAIIMAAGFKEKLPRTAILSIILVFAGIILFYKGKQGQDLNITGLLFVFISAMCYAVYMILIKKNNILKRLNISKLTFYVMLFGLSVFIYNLHFCVDLQPISRPLLWFDVLMLAVLPTIAAIEMLNISIRLIGPTLSAIISALEPVSAMFFCVIFFHEELTYKIVLGIIAILAGVYFVVADKGTNPVLEKEHL